MEIARLADELIALPEAERLREIAALSEAQRRELRPFWRVWAHPGQLAPETDWHTWVIMAGRAIIYLT